MRSRIAYLLCATFMLYACFIFYPKWKHTHGEATIGWDVSGYYWYLPSIFIYKDLKQQRFGDSLINKYNPTPAFEQSFVHESGNRVMVYSSGMAIMYLPAFTTAHMLAKPLGYPADGFSLPYQFALQMAGLIVSLVGVWYFRKLMKLYFDDNAVAVMLLLLVFGTNYLNYSAIDGSQTHNWLFTIYVFLLLSTQYFYQTRQTIYAVWIGILCGLAILIRPSEMISILLPLLWGMESISGKAIGERIAFLMENKRKVLLAGILVIAIGMIQVAYWLYVTGQPLVYSYQEKGFSWLSPHLNKYMFSYRSGWLIYTPLLVFSLVGIIPFLFKGKNKVAVLSFFVLNLYIVSAWDIWWYGGTGGRAMIQSYPIILFPFASLVQEMFTGKRFLKWVLVPAFLIFSYVNIWFTYNAHAGEGLYDPNGMCAAYYWAVVGRFHVPDDTKKLKDTEELFRGTPKNMKLIYENDFEKDTALYNPLPAIEGKHSVYLDRDHANSERYKFAYADKKKGWIRAQAIFRTTGNEWEAWKMTQFVVRFMDKDKPVKENAIRVNRFLSDNTTRELYIDVKKPDVPFDSVSIHFWLPDGYSTILADNLKVWSFN